MSQDAGEALTAEQELRIALEYYSNQYCEGWCRNSPPSAVFDDCGGCIARQAIFKATEKESDAVPTGHHQT